MSFYIAQLIMHTRHLHLCRANLFPCTQGRDHVLLYLSVCHSLWHGPGISGACCTQVPFFVGTTAGTTVLGAFDPFDQIAAICKKHRVWMHVDGCWGAAALLSPEHRHLMKGCELSDSLAWNPHKLMGLPLQCSAFLTTHKGWHGCARSPSAWANARVLFVAVCLIMSDVMMLPVGF